MSDSPKYPDMAGWKGNKLTGIHAAFAVPKDMGRRHAEVLAAFASSGTGGTTCDAIALDLGLPVHVVRPRASELERRGKLFPIGKAIGGLALKVTVYSVERPFEQGQR
jgi:hypothetical protein